MRTFGCALLVIACMCGGAVSAQEQNVDSTFGADISHPTYTGDGPRVVIDQAHLNFHTASGQYAPLANLLRADGYKVSAGDASFDARALSGADVLVIANAGSAHGADTTAPAFLAAEIEALEQWVRAGGSLLLIADHAPFGVTAEALATRLGVKFGKGWAFERGANGGLTTQIVYSRENGRFGDHPITRGRSADETLKSVRSFTGQSIVGPEGSTALLRLPAEAWEAPDRGALDQSHAALQAANGGPPALPPTVTLAGGRAQAVAFEHGKGRVVVLGEAGILSAQLVRLGPDKPIIHVGMNDQRYDNRQFALNLFHWLSRKID